MLTGACRTTFRPILTSSINCHIRSRDQALGSREVLSRSSGRYAFNLFAYQLAQLGQGRPKRELTECVPPAAPAHSLGGRVDGHAQGARLCQPRHRFARPRASSHAVAPTTESPPTDMASAMRSIAGRHVAWSDT